MKLRITITISVLFLTVLSAIGGAAGARSAAGSPSDFIRASFDDQYDIHWVVKARSVSAGARAHGFVETSSILFGNVVCLVVHEHEALVTVFNREIRLVFLFTLRDNHPGPDEFLWIRFYESSFRPKCEPFDGTHGYPGTPVSGYITMHDAHQP